ncbi:MAG: 50S ribosomal protein L18 [Candidatus Woesearchaeota archaeon]
MEYKRKKENRTDYGKRLKLLKSGKPRLVIRDSLKSISAQVVQYEPDGDKTLVSAHSKELVKLGYAVPRRNIPTAYLVGALIAKKSKEKSIKEVTPDTGFCTGVGGSVAFSLIKGVKDGGLDVNLDEKSMPRGDRIEGKHIADYAGKMKDRFSKYEVEPSKISNIFKEVKRKLIENA